jgi:hypothetical protein
MNQDRMSKVPWIKRVTGYPLIALLFSVHCGKMVTKVPIEDWPVLFCRYIRGPVPTMESFVLLSYSPEQNVEIAVLILFNGKALQVIVPPAWQQEFGADDREYLTEMIKDWGRKPTAEIPELMRELAELSVGSLRAMESGHVESDDRANLIQRVSDRSF